MVSSGVGGKDWNLIGWSDSSKRTEKHIKYALNEAKKVSH